MVRKKGFYFLRFYKAKHRDRVDEAIRRAALEGIICVGDHRDAPGAAARGKLAVFCREDQREAEALFFQHYTWVREERRRARLAPFGAGRT